jgi:hypothetical protein
MAVRRARDVERILTVLYVFYVGSTNKFDKVKRQQNGRACAVLMTVASAKDYKEMGSAELCNYVERI